MTDRTNQVVHFNYMNLKDIKGVVTDSKQNAEGVFVHEVSLMNPTQIPYFRNKVHCLHVFEGDIQSSLKENF